MKQEREFGNCKLEFLKLHEDRWENWLLTDRGAMFLL